MSMKHTVDVPIVTMEKDTLDCQLTIREIGNFIAFDENHFGLHREQCNMGQSYI